ncbi:hypothetical protein ZIOFF_064905 [Zingiber officinale]|uniref:PurM-like C-terminal domain-containing protein n=1 Tax=Zingiber officinale TaxID=94328 RepID=A0A8J5EWH2_ZINOF|nr:hypothetical protein ZIOFF_064905 [Zingiber officinale]
MGGGAASSMASGQNDAELDFNAVQRGDAEMAQKLYRVVRACVEMGDKNPIISIHDQGVGGNCNVVKEIIYPEGAEIDIRSIISDHTMCVTGLVAQQQTVGPLQLPLSDVAVISQKYMDFTGGACAIGEQPLKGNCGMQLNLSSKGHNLLQVLFAEELGLVLEVNSLNVDKVMQKLEAIGISSEIIGNVTSSPTIELSVDGIMQLKEQTSFLRDLWEETSST